MSGKIWKIVYNKYKNDKLISTYIVHHREDVHDQVNLFHLMYPHKREEFDEIVLNKIEGEVDFLKKKTIIRSYNVSEQTFNCSLFTRKYNHNVLKINRPVLTIVIIS